MRQKRCQLLFSEQDFMQRRGIDETAARLLSLDYVPKQALATTAFLCGGGAKGCLCAGPTGSFGAPSSVPRVSLMRRMPVRQKGGTLHRLLALQSRHWRRVS